MQVYLRNLKKGLWRSVEYVRKHVLLSVLMLVLLMAIIIVAVRLLNVDTSSSNTSGSSVANSDLLNGYDWSHFAGATQNNTGVHIKPLGRAIVNQDGSLGQQNPPVNVRGPHLEVTGDFQVIADLSGVTEKMASLQLYGEVPVIYDEWRHEGSSVRVDINNSKIVVSVWDGTGDSPVENKNFSWSGRSEVNMVVRMQGDTLKIIANGQVLGELASHQIFAHHAIWFGTDAQSGGIGWILSSLRATPINTGKISVKNAPNFEVGKPGSGSLRILAAENARHLPIGAAVAEYPLLTDASYRKLLANQFSMITPENAMKAQFIHPEPAVYSFEDADNLVEFASKNNMQIHGHALVFGEANPVWMQTLPIHMRQQVMIEHINTVVTHFKGSVSEWDVVNEPLADNDSSDTTASDMRQTIWFKAMGEQYIDLAFRTAKQADSSAKLYINDFGLEADGDRWESMVGLLQRMLARGVPIDGVGFQAHVYEQGDFINTAVLRRHIQQLNRMGLKSRISEIDVTGDDERVQAQQYADVLTACLAESSCTSFTTWGVSDIYGSTTSLHTYPLEYGNNLIWDSIMHPRPAYTSLQKVLQTK